MAARPAANPSPATVIDLTLSDSEYEHPHRASSNQSRSALTNSSIQDLPASNHGLILPRTFDLAPRRQHKRTVQNGNHKRALPVHQAGQPLRASRPGPRPKSAIRSQVNTTQASTNRRSTERTLSRILPRECHEENTPKRRKTDNWVSQSQSATRTIGAPKQNDLTARPQHTFSSTPAPVLPPVNNKMPGLVTPQIDRANAYVPTSSPLLAQGRKDVPARSQRLVTQPVIVLAPRRTMSLAERLDADRTRVSLDGRIQKSRNTSQRVASVGPIDQDGRMACVIRNQVIKHVKLATAQYLSSLSKDDLRKIGTKTAGELVTEPEFHEDFNANGGQLSPDYEQILSVKAQLYVDKYVLKILNKEAGSGDPLKIDHGLDSPSTTNSGGSPTPGDLNNKIDMLMASSSSSDPEEVFDTRVTATSSPSPNRGASRHYSSSPTTSFSIDDDRTNAMDVNSHDEPKVPYTVGVRDGSHQPRRSSRKPGLEKMPVERAEVRPQGQVSGQKQALHLQGSGQDFDAIREIQVLRLGAADKRYPRPYLNSKDRDNIRRGFEISGRSLSRADRDLLQQSVFHLDFCLEEIDFLCKIIQAVRKDKVSLISDPRSQILVLMSGQESIFASVVSIVEKIVKMPGKEVARRLLRQRGSVAIKAFLHDAVEGKIACTPQISQVVSTLQRKRSPARPLISSLLRQREIHGMSPFRVRRGWQPLNVEVASIFEDSLARKSEWTDCCGDISTVSWTGEDAFICGATAHSDYHNMQYNKPGNLVVGSTSLGTLRAVGNHRVIRPVIGKAENAENALESMRQTQDPWLYTSVVSTAHSEISGFTFSASFDHTVKIWKVCADDGSMDLRGAWHHEGKVNFVITSDHHERVATASDVSSDAIRVYSFDEEDISNTPFDTYCGDKAQEQAQEIFRRDTWAYFPATIQWGKAVGVAHLLLVGYSPRSITAHEIDIPEDKKNSGELCLWDVELGTKIPISSAKSQNVFEVMWHPTQQCFLAATSPCGNFEPDTRTQIRLFTQSKIGTFLLVKTLDCPAFDINELTLMPNSNIECYVTASCTDGNTYVWDTAQGDDPIHILGHGESLDNPIHDLPREIADAGVKFASWGKTVDRFYTGSSDGKVKAWNIRKPKGHTFVRTVLAVSGAISTGAFSKNFSKLLIGDSTGKVHLLEVDDSDPNSPDQESTPTDGSLSGTRIPIKTPSALTLPEKRPKVIIPHPEPDPPPGFKRREELTAQDIALQYLEEGHLTVHPDPAIGAVQGPNYTETMLFRYEAHEEADCTLPLLPEWQAKQRYENPDREEELRLPRLSLVKSSNPTQHAYNMSLDLDFSRLSLNTQQELTRDGVDLDFEPEQKFDFELLPRSIVFKEHKTRQGRLHNI